LLKWLHGRQSLGVYGQFGKKTNQPWELDYFLLEYSSAL